MINEFQYQIKLHEAQLSISDFLKSHGYSKHIITHLKRSENGIIVNGKWAYTRNILYSGDILTITLTEENSSENIVPSKLPLDIVYEDSHLLVINKSADMPIHPSQGNYDNTLANALAYYFKEKEEAFVYRCINRLDRDTTGLLIIAKNMLSGCILSRMVQARVIHRKYLAIVKGICPASGVIDAPIARVPGSTIERRVDYENGESAITYYQLLAKKGDYSLVSLKLETGRTHQIRVHMKHLGYPLLGDYLYNPDCSHITRQALHSHELEFIHPITKEPMHFIADIPEDMNPLFVKYTI